MSQALVSQHAPYLASGAACCWGVWVVVMVAIFSALVNKDALDDSKKEREKRKGKERSCQDIYINKCEANFETATWIKITEFGKLKQIDWLHIK